MAEIILGIGTSHSPMLSTPHEAFAGHAERDRANPRVPDWEALVREKAAWIGRHPPGRAGLPAAHDAGGVQLGAGAGRGHRLLPH